LQKRTSSEAQQKSPRNMLETDSNKIGDQKVLRCKMSGKLKAAARKHAEETKIG